MQAPANNESAVNINNRCQIHKSFLHWNICDVNAPDLIAMVNVQAPEQVWLDVGCASKLAQMLAMAHWHYVLYSAQNCGGKARLIGLKNVVYMVPRFPSCLRDYQRKSDAVLRSMNKVRFIE